MFLICKHNAFLSDGNRSNGVTRRTCEERHSSLGDHTQFETTPASPQQNKTKQKASLRLLFFSSGGGNFPIFAFFFYFFCCCCCCSLALVRQAKERLTHCDGLVSTCSQNTTNCRSIGRQELTQARGVVEVSRCVSDTRWQTQCRKQRNENEKKKERQGGEGYEESETGAEGSMQETDSL